MKRYLVFSGPQYYPNGGWGDFDSSYDNYDDAVSIAIHRKRDGGWGIWVQVVDTTLMEIVHTQLFDHDLSEPQNET